MSNSKKKKNLIRDKKMKLLGAKLRIELREDILKKYDNSNFWNKEFIDRFCLKHGLSEIGKTELLSNLL